MISLINNEVITDESVRSFFYFIIKFNQIYQYQTKPFVLLFPLHFKPN